MDVVNMQLGEFKWWETILLKFVPTKIIVAQDGYVVFKKLFNRVYILDVHRHSHMDDCEVSGSDNAELN